MRVDSSYKFEFIFSLETISCEIQIHRYRCIIYDYNKNVNSPCASMFMAGYLMGVCVCVREWTSSKIRIICLTPSDEVYLNFFNHHCAYFLDSIALRSTNSSCHTVILHQQNEQIRIRRIVTICILAKNFSSLLKHRCFILPFNFASSRLRLAHSLSLSLFSQSQVKKGIFSISSMWFFTLFRRIGRPPPGAKGHQRQ